MVVFPNCKINLGLNITGKRADGYHNLETVFFPLLIHDALEVIHAADAVTSDAVQFFQSGIKIDAAPENNLCVKAYQLLKADFPQLFPIKMHLQKTIPTGAGLGGGSADGTFTLLLLNKKFNLNLSTGQLINYALKLGSDCPFFIINKPCFAEGRGEVLEEIKSDLATYKFQIINPGIHINSGWAFSQIQPATPLKSIKEIIQQPIETWKEYLVNDFEEPVLQHHPQLRFIKELLYKQGAVYAAMSGSGSTFYGIFKSAQKTGLHCWPKEYFVKEVSAV